MQPCDPQSLTGPDGLPQAHVWYARTARCASPALLAQYLALLDHHERARVARFATDDLRAEYLLTRALCRTTLSHYCDVPPQAWSFRVNGYGCPDIAAPQHPCGVRFNLSNSPRLVACVVTAGSDAGIDVEAVDRKLDVTGIAARKFSAAERQAMQALPEADRRQRFFDIWTLKESYIKARRMGLAIALDQFSFTFDGSGIGIRFAPAMQDASEDWQFALHRLDDIHTLSVALRRPAGNADMQVHLREVVPLRHAAREGP